MAAIDLMERHPPSLGSALADALASEDILHRQWMLRAEAEAERQRLLARELSHRIKNTLATVQAIAWQTLHINGVGLEARQALNDRLVALGRAHDLLTEAERSVVQLDQLVRSATSAFELGRRFCINGPAIPVPPRQAVAVALALHELATNAIKYGALSSPDGHVDIAWRRDGERFRLSWIERGGPAVKPPCRTGFGTSLLKRNLAAELSGKIALDYAPEGLRCEIIATAVPSVSRAALYA